MIRKKLAHMAVQMEVGRMLEMRGICAIPDHIPTIESAMLKAWGAIVWSEMADMALDLMGPYGYLWSESPDAPMEGDMADQYLMSGHLPRGCWRSRHRQGSNRQTPIEDAEPMTGLTNPRAESGVK